MEVRGSKGVRCESDGIRWDQMQNQVRITSMPGISFRCSQGRSGEVKASDVNQMGSDAIKDGQMRKYSCRASVLGAVRGGQGK